MRTLLNRLRIEDDYIKKKLDEGLHSESKKYKAINYRVAKWSKTKASPSKQSSQTTSTMKFTKADESMLFGKDAPTVQQSNFGSSFYLYPDQNITMTQNVTNDTCADDK